MKAKTLFLAKNEIKDLFFSFFLFFGLILVFIFHTAGYTPFSGIFSETNRNLVRIFPEKQAASGTRARSSLGSVAPIHTDVPDVRKERTYVQEQPNRARNERGVEQISVAEHPRNEDAEVEICSRRRIHLMCHRVPHG